MTYGTAGRKAESPILRSLTGGRVRRLAAYSVVLVLIATAVPAVAVVPPGSLNIPDPPDYGIMQGLQRLQANESSAIDDPAIIQEATAALADVVAYDYARSPATGPFELHGSAPPPVQQLDLLPLVEDSPYTNLTNFLAILLDQPLMVMIMVKSGDHVTWVETRIQLLGNLGLIEGGLLDIINGQRWELVDVDEDSTTGDASGNDIRLRMGPVMHTRERNISFLPFNLTWIVRGGLAIEIERLGTGSEDLPLETTYIKPFRYNNINYTWFLEYKVDRIPERARLSLIADNVDLSRQRGDFLQRLLDAITGGLGNMSLNGSEVARIAGPYTIANDVTGDLSLVQASLGYLKIQGEDPSQPADLSEASWLTVRVKEAEDQDVIPRSFSLWLDSPSFNRSFDHLNWTADLESTLELEYFDDRDNLTQARGIIDEAPTNLRLQIDNVTESVGPVSKVHYTASAPVGKVRFDEWEFMGDSRSKYLHSHVELGDLPTEFWLNGTLDIGGQAFDPLQPDPTVRNVIPQLMDAMMTRLASKLFTVGRTLRSVPQNILNMPDKAGYTFLDVPRRGEFLGKLELWLTSDHYALVEEGTDFFAFYNDTVDPVGPMVQTGFSARLMDIKSFYATFSDKKHVVLDSRYNREFRALFIDEKNHANASLWFSNIPHNISLEILDDELVYMGDGTVDRVQYTSEIGEQYMRLVMEGVPGGVRIHQGDETSGVSALLGSIDSLDLQVTDGRVRHMLGDHLMVEIDPGGTTSASVHLSDLKSLVLDRTQTNHVSLRTGGNPFSVLIGDRTRGFDLAAKLDPLPSSLEADVSDILGLGDIGIPSLNDITSVLDFASVIYAISDLGDDVIQAMGDVSTTMVQGLGTFSSDFDFNFTGDETMDLTATISRTGSVLVDPVPWTHGVTATMVPDGEDVLLNSKVFLTGLAPKGSIGLRSDQRTTILNLTLEGFAPRYPQVIISLDGASLVAGSGGKDIWISMGDLVGPMDLGISLDLLTDLRVGGQSKGNIVVETSEPLGPLHARMRTRDGQISTVELLLSSVPTSADVSFDYAGDITLTSSLSTGVDFVFIKLSRDLTNGLEPTSTIILHDVPTLVSLFTGSSGPFDMDSDSAVANLPKLTVSASEPGLDLFVDLDGRAMGNKADLNLDARNVQDLFMTRKGDEYRITSVELEFIHLSINNLVYSDSTLLKRIDLAAEELSTVTLSIHMVFGVYPLIDVDDLDAAGLQVTIDGTMKMGGDPRDIEITLLEVPLGASGLPRSHSNGIAVREAEGAHRLFIPAPITTLLGTAID
jgi:hypothetical protein